MEERNHFLLAAENFLGVELTSPDQVNSIFDKLSVEQISELIEHYKIHVAAWQPEASDNKPAMHLGRAIAYGDRHPILGLIHKQSSTSFICSRDLPKS